MFLFFQGWNTILLASQKVVASNLGWKRFDITSGVQKWFAEGTGDSLQLLVDCSGCRSLVKPVIRSSRPKKKKERQRKHKVRAIRKASNKPFLVIHTDSTPNRRMRRRALVCSAKTKSCCKERFYVSFKQLGWDDWIIAPSGYYANYCRGECSGPQTPDAFRNYHSHILGEYRKLDKFPELQPCCAPTKFTSMSLIYFGPDRNIIKRDLPKMSVHECGCP
ncbi:inhibin beta chain-like [Artemia franciscana]|uniref:inhibin beta chain-like n=1 Tax=Artemia franciscana TaxID=6661 RepID=UPI0032DB9678